MLDTCGIIRVLTHTQARHIDAARNLLYHNLARPIGLCVCKQPYSATGAGFLRASEVMMPPGQYDHKPTGPRAPRVTLICEWCGEGFELLASEYRKRKIVRYCSKKCMGYAKRKPESKICIACDYCGISFIKRADHITDRNYCTQVCLRRARYGADSSVTTECSYCGKSINKCKSDMHNRNYCSKQCSADALRVPDAKWNNKQYIRSYMRSYTDKHREKHNAHARRWGAVNKDKKTVTRQARRAKASIGDFNAIAWGAMKLRYAYRCLCCGRSEPEIKLTLDHIIPLALGGAHTEDNIQPLCSSCNSSKGVKTTDYRGLFSDEAR